jgi:hypothetical protein
MSLPTTGRPLAVDVADSRARSRASSARTSGGMCLAKHITNAPMPSTRALMVSAFGGKLGGSCSGGVLFMGPSFSVGDVEVADCTGLGGPAFFRRVAAVLSGGHALGRVSSSLGVWCVLGGFSFRG